jgi:hypothetical protein
VTIGGRTRVALEREKALVLRSIKELEFDFAMGRSPSRTSTRCRAACAPRLGADASTRRGGGIKEQIAREVEARLANAGVGAESAVGAEGACAKCDTHE